MTALLDDHELLRQVEAVVSSFGVKCKKLGGAVTVEVLREALTDHGICVSARDVYIRGLPNEIDLLVPTKTAKPKHGILYEPDEVLCVLEVKKLGSFGAPTVNCVKALFERVAQLNSRIQCAYVTLEERKGYKWASTQENLGFPCFTLFWYSGRKGEPKECSRAWSELLRFLDGLTARQRPGCP